MSGGQVNAISHCHDLHLFLSLLRVLLGRLEESVQMNDGARAIIARLRREIGNMEDKRASIEKEEQAFRNNRGALGHE
jgi:FtsZ-binding cell division protein ZapB